MNILLGKRGTLERDKRACLAKMEDLIHKYGFSVSYKKVDAHKPGNGTRESVNDQCDGIAQRYMKELRGKWWNEKPFTQS
jgi:hypothetical protein